MLNLHFNTHAYESSTQQHSIYSNSSVHAAVLCSMNERASHRKEAIQRAGATGAVNSSIEQQQQQKKIKVKKFFLLLLEL